MILQTIRVSADALRHDRGGVAAQLAAISRDPLYADADVPAVRKVLDPTTHRGVARGVLPDEGALLIVTMSELATLQPSQAQNRRDGRIPVTVWYASKDPDAERATAATLYTLQAVVECFNWLNLPAQEPERRRGRIIVSHALDLTANPIEPIALGPQMIRGRVVVTWKVRDVGE